MLVLKSFVKITQQPSDEYPTRKDVFTFDFINNFELNSSWLNLTDTGKLILPKKVYIKNKQGKAVTWFGKDLISNPNEVPILLRGDKIEISLGYEYYEGADKKTELNKIFEGYISNIINRMPIELDLEDNMWLLKQVQAPNKTYNTSLEEIIKDLLTYVPNQPFTYKDKLNGEPIVTTFGTFTTQNETIAQVLDRLQKDFRFESYFRGNELRCGSIVYYPEDRETKLFKFQYNVISDTLQYKRVDDVKIGVYVNTFETTVLKTKNKDGSNKVSTKKVKKFGYYKKGVLTIVDDKPNLFDGEVRTINGMAMPADKLNDYVTKELNRVTWNGWRGSFVGFGLPKVKHGDAVNIVDNILPERNGTYMVKQVVTTFGMEGFRQEIHLDLRIDTLSQSQINSGL